MAKYEKGTFSNIPNIHMFCQMTGSTAKVYVAICKYADDNGQCFPGATKIGEIAGVTRKTVFTAIKELELLNVLSHVQRENATNLYQIELVSNITPVKKTVLGSVKNGTRGSVKNGTLTISLELNKELNKIAPDELVRSTPKKRGKKTQAEKEADAMEPIDFNEKIKIMMKDEDRRVRIIAWYWKVKRFNFKTKGAYETALRRELRPAGNLLGYTGDEIKAASEYCDREYSQIKWTLETISKVINDAKAKVGEGEKLVF